MPSILKIIIVLIYSLFLIKTSKATHFAGGDMTYECVGPNRFVVTLNFFRDCSGVDAPNSVFITMSNSCGGSESPVTLPLLNPGGTEVSQLCPSSLSSSECNGGNLTGMQRYTYRDTIDIPNTCPGGIWTLGFGGSSRNPTINVQSSAFASWFISATINLGASPCNDSPYFTAQPIPYICANQVINYSYGVVETENDSLRYSFVPGNTTNSVNNLIYIAGFSAASPIPGIVINPLTGQINFTSPATQGNYIVVVQVDEYDRATGLLKGSIRRDIQFVVIACANNIPDNAAGTITSFTPIQGTPSQANFNTIQGCEGDAFSWQTVYTDIDVLDVLTITTNFYQIFTATPATYTLSGTNPLTVTWSLLLPSGAAGLTGATKSFSVTVSDQACPIPGNQTFTYNVDATPATYAGADWIICGTQSAQPTAYGGSIFTWLDLANVPIPVDPSSFTCNPCASPSIRPAAIGSYSFVVESNLAGGCKNRDTIKVIVSHDFVPGLIPTDSICLGVPVVLDATPTSTFGLNYTYSWLPATGLSSTNIANPNVTFLRGGIYTYTSTISSDEGCVKKDTIVITISHNRDPIFAEIKQEVPICLTGSANLTMNFGTIEPSMCGLSTVGTCTTLSTFSSGNKTGNSSGTIDTPFKGFFEDGRMVSLFRANELLAQGLTAGKIQGLKLTVTSKSSQPPYTDFTIKMGCTNLIALTTNFPSGLTPVFTANYSTVLGINAFSFPVPYEWDGISNLLIEICFDNTISTSNDAVAEQTTTYASSAQQFTFGESGCTLNTPSTLNSRPVYTFDWCSASANPNSFYYAWSPATGLSATNIYNPIAVPPSDPFSYTVILTDKIGDCTAITTKAIVFTVPFNPEFVYDKSTYCKNQTNPTPTLLSSLSAGVGTFSSSPPGLFFANTTNGTINLAASLPNTYTIKRTITYQGGACSPSIATYTLAVLPVNNAAFTYSSLFFCKSGALIENPIKADPAAMGSYTFVAMPINVGLDLNMANGQINMATSDMGQYTVYFTTDGICPATDSTKFTIGMQPTTSFSYALNPYCKNMANPIVNLLPGSMPGSYSVVSANGAGLTFVNALTGEVNMAATLPGTYSIKNQIDPVGGCVLSSYSTSLQIMPVDITSFAYAQLNYCLGNGTKDPLLMPMAMGSFTASPMGLAIEPLSGQVNLSASAVGSYMVSFASTGVCTTTSSQALIVRELPNAAISYTPSFSCEGSGLLVNVTKADPAVVGTFTFPNDLVQFANNTGRINVSASKPSNIPYVVTYTVKGAFCANSGMASFTVIPKDDAGFLYKGYSFCKTGPNPLPTVTGVPGGVFSSSSLGFSVAASGEILLDNCDVGGPYQVVYTTPIGSTGCTNKQTVEVFVTNGATAEFSYEDPYCINLAEFISAKPTLLNGASAGYFSAEPQGLVFENTSTGIINLGLSKPGLYTVTNTVGATENCKQAVAMDVVELVETVAAFSASPLTGLQPLEVTFSNLSTGATSYTWDFGNGETAVSAEPTASYKYVNQGVYRVVLTASGANNCVDTAMVEITVDNTSVFVIPNVFSPDGDGINDEFKITLKAIASFDGKIYNRWGKKVFEWKDQNLGWDGAGYPQGVYYYMIKAQGEDKINYDKNGTVTLFRKQ